MFLCWPLSLWESRAISPERVSRGQVTNGFVMSSGVLFVDHLCPTPSPAAETATSPASGRGGMFGVA